MTFDPQCFELAKHFLPNGTEAELSSLAKEIQYAVENGLSDVWDTRADRGEHRHHG